MDSTTSAEFSPPLLSERSDYSGPTSASGRLGGSGKDVCLGRVVLGAYVRGEKERSHWASVMATPRKMHSVWQSLY